MMEKVPIELYSSEQMRLLDNYVIDVLGVPGTLLMRNAAEHVAAAATERLGPDGRVAVFCGTGNNGGDGICAAAILIKEGRLVRVFLVGDEGKMTEDAKHMRRELVEAGGTLELFSDCHDIEAYLRDCDVIIDAMFGIGLNTDLRGDARKAATMINESKGFAAAPARSSAPAAVKPFVLAVDVPSGVHADTGGIMGAAVKADATITFTRAKHGLYIEPGSANCGEILVKDIGIDPKLVEQISSSKETEKFFKESVYDIKKLIFMVDQAANALNDGRLGDAAKILEMAHKDYPWSDDIDRMLAKMYELSDQPVKAIRLWEGLFKKNPDDAKLSYRLAVAYDNQGWSKKALKQYETTVSLNPDNSYAWATMVDLYRDAGNFREAHETCFYAMKILKRRGIENMHLYAHAFIFTLAHNPEEATRYLNSVLEMMKSDENLDNVECDDLIYELLVAIDIQNKTELLPYIREMIGLLPGIDEETAELAEGLQIKSGIASIGGDYPPTLQNLLYTLSKSCGCKECANDIASCECSILYDLTGYRPYIGRLSEEHPDLYALGAAFFDMAMSEADHAKEFNARLTKMDRRGVEPILYRADNSEVDRGENIETYRREGPKIGRNDACPCGSGKKYKKCCGR